MGNGMATLSAGRVLVVDDDRTLADTLVTCLNQNGFDADAVYTAPEAIERAVNSRPDSIVMDVFLNGIDGVDAAIAICETIPGSRILLISGNDEAYKRLEKGAVRGHHFDLLMKPIQPSCLFKRLRTKDNKCCDGSNWAA